MISQIPGQRHVVVDFPRPDRQIVTLAPAIAALPKEDVAPGLWMPVGVTPAGKGVALDLATLPHILLAGASGAGKTVAGQAAVLSLACRLSPDQLEIVIIDPKAIDFSPFASLPHLRGGRIVTEPEEAINVLGELTGPELAERTRILQDARCPNIRELRARRPDLGVKHIVVAIDEYAELVTILPKTEREEFERQILRLAQRARAVGIHMIIATQRPTTEFVTGAVKANLPTRISFRLPQRVDSTVIIDQAGAENLLGAGDMLLLHEGRLQRLQGYFVSMDKIATLVTELAHQRREHEEATSAHELFRVPQGVQSTRAEGPQGVFRRRSGAKENRACGRAAQAHRSAGGRILETSCDADARWPGKHAGVPQGRPADCHTP